MKITHFFLIITACYLSSTTTTLAQWSPSGGMIDIAVHSNCSMTRNSVAAAKSDGIYYCYSRAAEINTIIPDAGHFFLVHEYGHFAVHSTSQKLADCWAAHQLANARNGPHYVRQWIKYWHAYGTLKPNLGTREERIANVRSCCACGV